MILCDELQLLRPVHTWHAWHGHPNSNLQCSLRDPFCFQRNRVHHALVVENSCVAHAPILLCAPAPAIHCAVAVSNRLEPAPLTTHPKLLVPTTTSLRLDLRRMSTTHYWTPRETEAERLHHGVAIALGHECGRRGRRRRR